MKTNQSETEINLNYTEIENQSESQNASEEECVHDPYTWPDILPDYFRTNAQIIHSKMVVALMRTFFMPRMPMVHIISANG